MDFSFFVGIVVSLGLVIYSIFTSGQLMDFIDMPSVYIVFGCFLGALVACYGFKKFIDTPKHIAMLFSKKSRPDPEKCIQILKEMAQEARVNGVLALENKVSNLDDKFLKDAIMLVVDAIDSEKIRNSLELEIHYMSQRHMDVCGYYGRASSLAPAFGMIGTLIGLVNMLKNMSDAAHIGQDMAVALITTFYGTILANGIFIPISAQLKNIHEQEVFCKELIIEGVLDIQAGENPQYISDKLTMMISNEKSKNKKK